jgi:predicted small secreted protein
MTRRMKMKRSLRRLPPPIAAVFLVAVFLTTACNAGQGAASPTAAVASSAGGPETNAPTTASNATPSRSPGPLALPEGELAAGTYTFQPFAGPDVLGLCAGQHACKESPADDSIRITFTVPDGWVGLGNKVTPAVERYSPPGGAALIFSRGGWLYSKPCGAPPPGPDIPTGTTVDEFVTALVDHPDLDVTRPVVATLAGYSGKYLELRAPANTTTDELGPKPGGCNYYFVWEPGIYAQGPNALWRIWILDVNGVRVVVRADSFPGTKPKVQTQLKGIVDSIQIEP